MENKELSERKKTKQEKNIDILSTIILAGTIVWVVVMWKFLPGKIPRHYNAAGDADAWSGKGILIFDLAVEIGMYLLMIGTKKFPGIWNVPRKKTKEEQETVYAYSGKMLSVINVAIMVMFTYMTVCSGLGKPLGSGFLWISLAGTFIPMIYYTVKMYKV